MSLTTTPSAASRRRIGAPAVARLAAALALVGSVAAVDARAAGVDCGTVRVEERRAMDDRSLDVEVAAAELAAFERIFRMIDELREADAVDRLTHLRAQNDFEAAGVELERARLELQRQSTLVRIQDLACAGGDRARLDRLRADYARIDCEQQAKAIDIARIGLAFQRELLASVQELKAGSVATQVDLIRAELDVEREELRLADALRRTETCRAAATR